MQTSDKKDLHSFRKKALHFFSDKPWLLVFFWFFAATFLASCFQTSRVVFVAPRIPGAEFVGSSECSMCHESLFRYVEWSAHANLYLEGEDAKDSGCEACHGPGSLHSEEGEGSWNIINPGRSPEVCLNCHLDVRGQFSLAHSHPVGKGKLTCIDCHDPHGKDRFFDNAKGILTDDDGCVRCHSEQRGPFVFEHEALREGCTTCHTPHGSINDALLKTRNGNLCLQCHSIGESSDSIMLGGIDHTGFGFLRSGTCWTAGCHEAVHGSNTHSSLRF